MQNSIINLMCTSPAGDKKLKIRFKASGTHERDMKRKNIRNGNSEHSGSLRNSFHRFDEPERTEGLSKLPQSILNCKSQKARVVRGLSVKSKFRHISAEPSASKFSTGKFSNSYSSLLKQRVRNPTILTADLIRKEQTSAQFLSVMTHTGRMVRNKSYNRLSRTKSLDGAKHRDRLSEAGKLQLFRTLLKKPVTTLDLRACFGISKQALKGLCKRGLLAEVWGPRTVGLRFKLTQKGKAYLNELEAAAKYDSNIPKRVSIRLKTKS